jgi:site-specific DNA-methyltransferase (adenine-specific)
MKIELYNDNFQNYKRYNIPKAQLVIADIPYNLGVNAYASSTEWYIDGDNKKAKASASKKKLQPVLILERMEGMGIMLY